ncbi:MAG: YybH family protein [bacterium]
MTILSTSEQVENAFYAAFASCSVRDMDAVWAESEAICIHPGAAALSGKSAVMNSWARILTAGDSVEIEYEVIERVIAKELAVHIVREILTQNDGRIEVMATNVYRCQDGDWKMVEHHGSQAVATIKSVPSKSNIKRTLQ